jgi:transcriptional regulator with GAF, ATPase, and Fis domain
MAMRDSEVNIDARILRAIVEGAAAESGERFFHQLVRHLARALGTKCAWVTEWLPQERRLRALAFWVDDEDQGDYEYDVAGTPCEPVVEDREFVHLPERVLELYPDDPDLPPLGAVSYLGVPLMDIDGHVLGHLAVLHDEPLPEDPHIRGIFEIFAGRAAAELRRLRRDRALRESQEEQAYLRAELESLGGFEEIVGESDALRALLEDVGRVARTPTTVLITGETGTGKELVARAIHNRSARAEGPLIKVNCAAIPEGLQESEFFGHEKGAFTGATSRRPGRFKLADGGTIFLDEVGELPGDLQAKLLRVLQEGEFEAVGSERTERVDVRVIAATHQDLGAMVADGHFREDLLYRLNVFPMHVPPLRERGEDVVMLAERFAGTFSRSLGWSAAALGPADIRRLCSYGWPGNVRELQNVIERAVITSPDKRHLNLERALPDSAPAPLPGAAPSPPASDRVLTAAELREFERENLLRALELSGWKVSGSGGAADRLGMRPNTLGSRMKALGIRRPAGHS